MRACRLCQNNIPNWTKIDGIRKNLRNRKYCLACSPWGKHNTKQLDGKIKTSYHHPVGSKEYNREKYLKHKNKINKNHGQRQLQKARQRKNDLIHLKGGGCKNCGYNKCQAALEFHHRNEDEKLFNLSLNFLWMKTWKNILKEVEKCDLFCANCHREHHHGTEA